LWMQSWRVSGTKLVFRVRAVCCDRYFSWWYLGILTGRRRSCGLNLKWGC
jgi:hypothetical protein